MNNCLPVQKCLKDTCVCKHLIPVLFCFGAGVYNIPLNDDDLNMKDIRDDKDEVWQYSL